MFCDVSGYTAMSERLDPEDVREIVDQVCGVAAEIIESYGGRIDKVLGDAVMAVFGDPIAHEDDAERAVRSALDIHGAIDRLSPAIELRTGFAVKLHTGINTGVVVTGAGDSEHPSAGPLGDTVNLASRLEGLAAPGDILLGPATSRLVGGVFDLEDLGDQAVKGKAGHIAIARVVGVAADRRPPSRRHGEFVGRQEELGVLLAAVERLRDGAGGVITVVGEAGAGKTRILSEVRDRIGEDVRWLEGRAYAFGERTPYAPVIDLISRVVGIVEGDAPEKVRRRLEETVSGVLGGDPTNIVGPLLRLYAVETAEESAIDREAFQGRLFHSTSSLIEGLASGRPTVVCLQDLHWADPPTVSLVQELVELLRSKVLFVFNTRPGFQLAAGERTIHLSELSSRQTRQLVASLLGTPDPPSELVTFVESRTDGNPFFMEEVVNSLIEAGLLAISGGRWSVQGRIDEATVPVTIRGVIAARIDRLDQTRRRVLQEASVVGREFLYRIVNEVSGSGSELAPSLSVLERADLIRERTSDPDLEYLFKHALTQEVAYGSLVRSERYELHARVGRAIETQLGHRLGEFTEVLAHHWLSAGENTQAVHYLRLAGRKAVERYAVDEADHFYRQAYELMAGAERSVDQDRALCETLIEWMVVQYYRGTFIQIKELLERHADDFERVGDPELTGLALGWRGNAEFILMDLRRSLDLLDQAIEIGRQKDNPTVLANAITWKLWTLLFMGRIAEVLDEAAPLPDLISRLDDERYVVIKSGGAIAWASALIGRFEDAMKIADDLVELGELTASSRALSVGYSIRTLKGLLTGDWTLGIDEGKAAVRAAQDPVYRGVASIALVNLLATLARVEGLRAALDAGPHSDDLLGELHRWAEGVCLGLEGQPAQGMRMLERARQRATEIGSGWGVACTDFYIAATYARISTGEVSAPLTVALRNPGFVFRYALPARRKARLTLEQFRVNHLEGRGFEGLRFNFEYELAKFLAHSGDKAGAAQAARRALDATHLQADTEGRRHVAVLLEGLERDLE